MPVLSLRFVDARNYGAARLQDCPGARPRLRLVQLDGEYVLRVAIERVRLLWEDPHVPVPLHLHQEEAGADLVSPDVGGSEHGVTVDAGREVVHLRRLLEEAGPGEAVLAVGLHDVVNDISEEQPGGPRLRAKAGGVALAADVPEVRGHGLVPVGLLAGTE